MSLSPSLPVAFDGSHPHGYYLEKAGVAPWSFRLRHVAVLLSVIAACGVLVALVWAVV